MPCPDLLIFIAIYLNISYQFTTFERGNDVLIK